MPFSKPESDWVNVNGIRLHYLDWGGAGPTLLFLTAMGHSAYIFNKIAPRFTDQFRVLALTRRGQADSDCPETGYDADTLTEDIRQFLDQLQVEKASLAGHSLAGVELTHFAATYPDRVENLVYLDALDDRRGLDVLDAHNPLKDVEIKKLASEPHSLEEYLADKKRSMLYFGHGWSDVYAEDIAHLVQPNAAGIWGYRASAAIGKLMFDNLVVGYAPKPVSARIPTLSFVVQRVANPPPGLTEAQIGAVEEFTRAVVEPFVRSRTADFQNRFPQAKIVMIPAGHHFCFIFQEDLVYAEMREFLLRPSPRPLIGT